MGSWVVVGVWVVVGGWVSCGCLGGLWVSGWVMGAWVGCGCLGELTLSDFKSRQVKSIYFNHPSQGSLKRRPRTVECVWVLTVAMVTLPGQKGDPGLWSVPGF